MRFLVDKELKNINRKGYHNLYYRFLIADWTVVKHRPFCTVIKKKKKKTTTIFRYLPLAKSVFFVVFVCSSCHRPSAFRMELHQHFTNVRWCSRCFLFRNSQFSKRLSASENHLQLCPYRQGCNQQLTRQCV